MKKTIKFCALVVSVVFVTGCVKQVPLETSRAEKIKSTKIVIAKRQPSLKLAKNSPVVIFYPNPVVLIGGSIAHYAAQKLVFERREQAAFAPIANDLESFSFEKELEKSLEKFVYDNNHFKFSITEIINIERTTDLVEILQNISTDHMAVLLPTYVVNPNMNDILINVQLSVYEKNDKRKGKAGLPPPIYQTSAKYDYHLPKSGYFTHVKNAKRLSDDNSKLMLEILHEGISKISKELMVKLDKPLAK